MLLFVFSNYTAMWWILMFQFLHRWFIFDRIDGKLTGGKMQTLILKWKREIIIGIFLFVAIAGGLYAQYGRRL